MSGLKMREDIGGIASQAKNSFGDSAIPTVGKDYFLDADRRGNALRKAGGLVLLDGFRRRPVVLARPAPGPAVMIPVREGDDALLAGLVEPELRGLIGSKSRHPPLLGGLENGSYGIRYR